MLRKILSSLSIKIFIISFLLQALSGALICTVLFLKTPTHSARGEVSDLVIELGETPRAEGIRKIDAFIERTGMDLAIYQDPSSDPGFSTLNPAYLEQSIGEKTLKSVYEVRQAMDSVEPTGYGLSGFSFAGEDEEYCLAYFDYGTRINTMDSSIRKSLPTMVVVILVLSLITSAICTRLFATPVKRLSKISKNMAELDFKEKCPENRRDELGDLARDLNRMSDTLDQKIRELKEEVRRVQEMEQQKEVFFAASSHELKTPVTILEGNLRGMLEGVEPYNDHDEYLSRSLRTVKRMESLISEILTASKMQYSEEIALEKTDFCDLITQKLGEMEELLAVREITVETELPESAFIMGNKELTAMAIGSFLGNAVLYSKEGSVITVRVRQENDQVLCEIRNRDAHIDEEDLPHLFEPFFRSDASRSRNKGGSGLGLYIAKLIVTKQSGSCELKNEGNDVAARIHFPVVS